MTGKSGYRSKEILWYPPDRYHILGKIGTQKKIAVSWHFVEIFCDRKKLRNAKLRLRRFEQRRRWPSCPKSMLKIVEKRR